MKSGLAQRRALDPPVNITVRLPFGQGPVSPDIREAFLLASRITVQKIFDAANAQIAVAQAQVIQHIN